MVADARIFRVYDPAQDAEVHARLIAEAFNSKEETVDRWAQLAGYDNIRVMEQGGEYAATCLMIPMAQNFGGSAVSMCGVAGVAVRPQFRSQGIAKGMMRQLLVEMHDAGHALSALYASTLPLYRSVAYEQAGDHYRISLKISDLPKISRLDQDLCLSSMQESDFDEVYALNQHLCQGVHGSLVRGDYCWQRILNSQHTNPRNYVVRDKSDVLVGAISFHQSDGDPNSFWHQLNVNLLDARTPEALDVLIHFLASYGAMANQLHMSIQPRHPLLLKLPEQNQLLEIRERWLLRVLDVVKALQQRSYPGLDDVSLIFSVTDSVIDSNNAHFKMFVQNGKAHVEEINSIADFHLDIQELAALYSGLWSAEELFLAGRIKANKEQIELLNLIFASPTPCMMDMF